MRQDAFRPVLDQTGAEWHRDLDYLDGQLELRVWGN